jgi:hypothetical protein
MKAPVGLLLCFTAILAAGAAEAQIFISATGNDSNACSRTAPCRTLQRGINATGAGREMTILTAGEYGTATINKSITITAVGVPATVRALAGGSNGIYINSATAVVVLRNLFFLGGGSGQRGIFIDNAAAVHIVSCEIERFVGSGILSNATNTEIFVTDSISRNNGVDGMTVVGNGSTRVTIDNSRFENNAGIGLTLNAAQSSVARSVFSGNNEGLAHGANGGDTNVTWSSATHNGGSGFSINSGSMQLKSSEASDNSVFGIYLEAGATARISDITVTNNGRGDPTFGSGIRNNGTVLTLTDNLISGNGDDPADDVAGTPLTTLPPK